MDSRKRMLVILGIAVLAHALWSGMFLMFLASSFGESGSTTRQEENYGLWIFSILWPFLEVAFTWIWIALAGTRYSNSEYRTLGNRFVAATLILTPLLILTLVRLHRIDETTFFATSIGIPFVGHWTARILWIKQKAVTTASGS